MAPNQANPTPMNDVGMYPSQDKRMDCPPYLVAIRYWSTTNYLKIQLICYQRLQVWRRLIPLTPFHIMTHNHLYIWYFTNTYSASPYNDTAVNMILKSNLEMDLLQQTNHCVLPPLFRNCHPRCNTLLPPLLRNHRMSVMPRATEHMTRHEHPRSNHPLLHNRHHNHRFPHEML